MKKQTWIGCFAALGVAVLILDAQTAVNAAQEAIQLCIHVVVPSLFPFFVLINILNAAILGCHMPMLKPLERLLHLPAGGGSLFLCGVLGGYPTGAQQVYRAWKDGVLDRKNAQRMLAFCSNAGPAFLFGIIGPMFSDITSVWLIWGIHILSAVVIGCVYDKDPTNVAVDLRSCRVSISASVRHSVTVMGSVCGWIILFRVIAAFCSRWFLWALPVEAQVIFTSILELANGSAALGQIENEDLRMIVASGAVSFGGICVLMQTCSVTHGLHILDYLRGKLLQTALSVGIATIFAVSLLGGVAAVISLLLITCIAGKSKFAVDFQGEMVYNNQKYTRKG